MSIEQSQDVNRASVDRLVITPQPLNGKPFRIKFINRGPEYWFNESIGYRHGRGPMLFKWKCPFGVNGEPKLIDGVWYWVRTDQS